MKNTLPLRVTLFQEFKLGLRMNLIWVFFLSFVLNLNANTTYSQISLNHKDTTIEFILNEIERNTEFSFVYKIDDVHLQRQVSIDVNNKRLSTVLDYLFKGTLAEFIVMNKQAILKKRIVDKIKPLDTDLVKPIEYEETIPESIQKTISGTVSDAEGQPLLEASIVEKGTSNGTLTDINGLFSLDLISQNPVLVVSYVGYTTQEITVGTDTIIDVQLQSDAALFEVIVLGYGTQTVEKLTGSVAQVQADDFNKRPITNSSQALQGVASGVYVSQLSGEPGQDVTQIRVRGVSTFTGSNAALVLVDGIEADINLVNPDDIQTITVLKDASATAIYGSRAANGVILVTTKRGIEGRSQLSIDAYSGIQTATRLPNQVVDPLTYINVHNTAFQVPTTSDLNGPIGGPFLSDSALTRYQAYLDATGFQGTNWLDEVYRTASINRINVSATAGSERTQYFVSASYLDQEGITIGTNSKQGTLRLNLDSQITDKIKIGTSITGSYRENNRPNLLAGGGQQFLAIRRHPTVPVRLPNGEWTGNKFEAGGFGANWHNPIALAEETRNTSKQLRTLGNVYIEYKPIKNLMVKGLASGNMTNIDVTSVDNRIDYWRTRDFFEDENFSRAGGIDNNSLNKAHSTSFNTLLQTTVDYTFDINETHNFAVLIGYSEELQRSEVLSGSTSDFNAAGIEVIGNLNPENEQAGGFASHIAYRSYFGRINYDYLGKYLFNVNFRADATSRFAPENRWGYFPSFSAGWIISREDFFKDNGIVSFLKLRGSWGAVGNQATGGLYLYQSSIAQNARLSYVFNDTQSLGAGPTSLTNRDAVWETAVKTDWGIEGRLLDNKLRLDFTYFLETRKDQLLGFPVPALAGGLGNPFVNLAEVDAWGWDMELGYSDRIGDFNFSFSGNLSHAENEVIRITEGVDRIIRGPANTLLIQEGYPIDQLFLIIADGLFATHEEAQAAPTIDPRGNQTAGDIKYIDQDGDGLISQQGSADDKVPVGKPYPELVYGFNITMDYKGIDLSIQANGVTRVDYWATYHAIQPFTSQGGIPSYYLDNSRSFNPNGNLPRVVFQGRYSGNEGLRFPSTFNLQPGGYLRIKNIQLGYSLPNELVRKMGLSRLRFYANAQNPFVFTKLFDFIDPERPLNNGGAVDFNRIPVARVLSAGLNITL